MPSLAERPRGLGGFLAALAEARDTAHFADRSAREYKDEARRNWSAVPCGTDYTRADRHSRAYFEEIERNRYRIQPWTAEAIDGFDLEDKRVLEVGFGAGTDHLRLARRRSRVFGVDLTWQNFIETTKRFEIFGRPRRAWRWPIWNRCPSATPASTSCTPSARFTTRLMWGRPCERWRGCSRPAGERLRRRLPQELDLLLVVGLLLPLHPERRLADANPSRASSASSSTRTRTKAWSSSSTGGGRSRSGSRRPGSRACSPASGTWSPRTSPVSTSSCRSRTTLVPCWTGSVASWAGTSSSKRPGRPVGQATRTSRDFSTQ